jgi:hypothetical protein
MTPPEKEVPLIRSLTHIPSGINALILASNMAAGGGSAGGVSLGLS